MSDTEVQHKVTKVFKNNVLKWVTIDDSIREYRAKMKELTNEKKQYEEYILNFLVEVEEKSIAIDNGKLTRNVSKSTAALKKENIHKALVEITGDSNKAIAMTDHILNSRAITERVNLKRTRNRKNKD